MNVIVLKNDDPLSNLGQNLIFHNEKDIHDYFCEKGYSCELTSIYGNITVKIRSEFGMVTEYSGFWAKFVK